jgi:cytochrome c-type biogenesis protein CcsB
LYFLKKLLPVTSRFSARLPETQTLDSVAYKAIGVGYPLFTVGALFAGAIWAEQAWGSFWSWDPKEVGSLIVWLVYSAYLHARFVKGWTGVRAAVLSAAGFTCTILTFFANLILGGLHAYG